VPRFSDGIEHDELLQAVAGSLQSTLVSSRALQAEPTGTGFIYGYRVTLQPHTDGAVASDTVEHTLYVETGSSREDHSGVLTLRNPATGEQADVWLYPADPELPALRTAVYAESASVVLGRLGLPVDGVRVSLAAYRPGKRAVVRVDATDAAYFLKVVRPSKAEPLQAQHTLWREAGMAVPRVLGWSDEGLVALEALDGVEMIGVLDRVTEPSALLDAIERVTGGIGAVRSIAVARTSLVRRVDWYEGRLLELIPEHASVITSMVVAIRRRYGAAGAAPATHTVHGDLHLAQILVDHEHPTQVTGVLDIDTSGWGDPADDAAALYGHLVATIVHDGGAYATVRARRCSILADQLRRRWFTQQEHGFADRAHAIAATQLLGHALSRSASGRAGAVDLIELAHRVVHADEKPLTGASW
jgi:Ser/Thr protein kinase RdoA (MazF antagonist)